MFATFTTTFQYSQRVHIFLI